MGWDKFEKLVELLKRRISTIVLHRLKDPRIGFVTITKIDLSRDLKECKVFYSVLGDPGEISRTTHALRDARGFIQTEVAKTLRTRIMPKIVFLIDEAVERVGRVERLLDELARERMASEENASADGPAEVDASVDGDPVVDGPAEVDGSVDGDGGVAGPADEEGAAGKASKTE